MRAYSGICSVGPGEENNLHVLAYEMKTDSNYFKKHTSFVIHEKAVVFTSAICFAVKYYLLK